MSDLQSGPVDDKAHIRHSIDLTGAVWQPAGPEATFAFVPHSDGETYVALSQSEAPDSPALIFTLSEWDAFLHGIRDGEFELP